MWLARGLLALAFVAQISNASLLPSMLDYDAPGHALNAFALYEGRLPDPRSWSGFHPPVYYALAAAAWRLGEGLIPVELAMRLVSVVAGLLAVLIVQRTLRRRGIGEADAAIVALVAYCTPVVVIATSMLGNEALCMLLVTAALARVCNLADVPPARLSRHALATGALAALAVLTKVTAALAVPVVAAAYLWHLRGAPRRAAAAALLAIALPALGAGLHFGHLMRATASGPSVVLSGSVASPEARAEMAAQPPGVRRLRDYVSFPVVAVLLRPHVTSAGIVSSVPGLFYGTLQADAMGHYLPESRPRALAAGALLAIAGLLPTGLALFGLLRMLRRPGSHAWLVFPSVYALLLVAAFAQYQWSIPHYSAGKASYLLSALLPAAGWLALGLGGLPARPAAVARRLLVAVAVLDVALLWQGHWR